MRRNLNQEAKEDKKPNNSYPRMCDDDKGPEGAEVKVPVSNVGKDL